MKYDAKKARRQLHGTPMTETLSRQGMTTFMNCPAGGVDPDNPFGFKRAKMKTIVDDPVLTKTKMKKLVKKQSRRK